MAGDPFLSDPSKKRKRNNRTTSVAKKSRSATPSASQAHDSEISSDSGESGTEDEAKFEKEDGDLSSDEEFATENAADKRRRLAKQYLENLKAQDLEGDFDAADIDEDHLARRLQEDVAETKGYVYKFYSDKIEQQLMDVSPKGTRIGSKNLTGVSVKHPYIYTVSKDMELIKWKDTGKQKPQRIKHSKGGARYFNVNTRNPSANHHCDQINCVAASPDGKYVVTGGSDARLIIWSAESLSCLKVLETRAAVNSITFRRGTDQLFAACADLRVRTFSINQFAQLEILYGHQDNITDISALGKETCVSVGSRDKTAMFWKIAEESRLTFRGGDSDKKKRKDAIDTDETFYAEGSIDVVSMVDETHFLTGSDNGNVSLWSLSKKKALFTERLAHGLMPQFVPGQASAETNEDLASRQIPERQPYWITAIYAIPYSDIFITGSYSGEVRVWKIERESFRSFSLVGSVSVKGCVVKIDGAELQDDKKVVVYVATSKEHKLGRWLGKVEGRNALTSLTFDI
ncbi:putative ribosomal RNA-processing protein [Clavispora lusitaniae]|uniref:Uncharacterized protein n=2 Tax=Clavispora lusitaniae TaxID=36911 RepID=C4Y9W3_CLAL4|nr:uncharacterized protein CLUG_05184 [Clavispora lusitaniae ATCC 42720]KAF7580760.1 WD domain, G-beta repeat family protein [Clavispora lusitaniae]EEQ41056.1 hypothetical protein CLUG_05184 [Clavispora lusitaniae ATCC 42720]QFZ29885.1 putative ribosomal RNA-processing protein [Clavispora lusitaniae]QFZ35535.1 putative ribosomal RNA-processing protein [Clavispora lusitaniae]QFZ41229.1 putative ribosomal RNA-processing protein [Clavispora lusitaniae]